MFADTKNLLFDLVEELHHAGVCADGHVEVITRRPKTIRVVLLSDDFRGLSRQQRQQIVWRVACRHPRIMDRIRGIETSTPGEYMGHDPAPPSLVN